MVRARLQGTLSPTLNDAALNTADGEALQLQIEATANGQLAPSEAAEPGAPALQPFVALSARVVPSTLNPAGPQTDNMPSLSAEARLHPWRAQPVQALQAQGQNLDAALFWAGAPRTSLSGEVSTLPGDTLATGWGLRAQIENRRAGPWDQGLLPLERLDVELRQDAMGWRMPQLTARLAETTLRAEGRAEGWGEAGGLRTWTLEAQALGLVPSRLLSTLQAAPQDFRLSAGSGQVAPEVGLDVRLAPSGTAGSSARSHLQGDTAGRAAPGVPLPALSLQGAWLPGQLRLDGAELRWQEAQLNAVGMLTGLATKPPDAASPGRQAPPAFAGQATLTAPGVSARLTGALDASGQGGAEGVKLRIDMGNVSTTLAWLRRTLARLDTALDTVWDAPPWQNTLPANWNTLALSGSAQLEASWGQLPPWAAVANALQAGSAKATRSAGPGLSEHARSPVGTHGWSAHLDMNGVRFQATPDAALWQIAQARTLLSGGGSDGGAERASQTAHWQLEQSGTLSGPMGEAVLDTLITQSEVARLGLTWQQGGAPLRLQLAAPVAYQLALAGPAAPTRVELAAGQLQLQLPSPDASSTQQGPVRLSWERTAWNGQRLQSQGRWQDLSLAALDHGLATLTSRPSPLAVAGLQTTLVLEGDWAIDLPLTAPVPQGAAPAKDNTTATLHLRRQSGDFTLPPELTRQAPGQPRLPAVLSESTLALQLNGQQLQADVRWASERMGTVAAQLSTELLAPDVQQGWRWPDTAPLLASARATLPDLAIWSALAPPGWRVNGLVALDVQASGTRAAPDWRGNIVADGLTLRSVVDGIDLRDGRLRATFNGRQLDITTLRLAGAGGDGVLEGSGTAVWPENAGLLPEVDLQMKATAMRVLSRADRRLSLSGDTRLALRGSDLQIDSALRVDQALFLLPDEATPSLGSDVVVLEPASKAAPTTQSTQPLRLSLNATLDLGRDFVLRGQGLNTGLRGQLQINKSPGAALPRVTGEIRTADGTYRAYGQALQIEGGVLRFIGPYDNPTLDILAVRTLPNQRAGVRILGTAQAPRIRLYADPDVPDSEKLALLVLGRPLSGAGAEAAILQQAALALLSGQDDDRSLVQALGLDEVSFQGESQLQDGSTTAAAITLGKRISNRLYLAYNRSLAGAVGTVQVFYDVSRRVTLRAQAGDDNAIDLIFTVNYD